MAVAARVTAQTYALARRQAGRIRGLEPQDQGDVVQDTFLRLVEKGVEILEEKNPAGFLFHALRLTAFRRWQTDAQKRRSGTPTRIAQILDLPLEERFSPEHFSPERFVAGLADFLRTQAEGQRHTPGGPRSYERSLEALGAVLRHGSYTEAARSLGRSKVAVRTAILRLGPAIRYAVSRGVL